MGHLTQLMLYNHRGKSIRTAHTLHTHTHQFTSSLTHEYPSSIYPSHTVTPAPSTPHTQIPQLHPPRTHKYPSSIHPSHTNTPAPFTPHTQIPQQTGKGC